MSIYNHTIEWQAYYLQKSLYKKYSSPHAFMVLKADFSLIIIST